MKNGQKILCHIDGDIHGIWRECEFDQERNYVIGKNFLFSIEIVTKYIDLETLTIVSNPLYKEEVPEIYKYRINEWLTKMTKKDEQKAKIEICERVKISDRTLHKWRYVKNDTLHFIAAEHLFKLAEFFNCEPRELYTNLKSHV